MRLLASHLLLSPLSLSSPKPLCSISAISSLSSAPLRLNCVRNIVLRTYASNKQIVKVYKDNYDKSTAVATTLAKAAVRTTYTAAGFLSIALASVMLYFLADLIINPTSENSVFQKCASAVHENTQVTAALGEPIHTYGYGVRSRPFIYNKYTNEEGKVRVKVEFDVEGPKSKGVVQAELEQVGIMNMKIVYLTVRLPGWKKDIHVVK